MPGGRGVALTTLTVFTPVGPVTTLATSSKPTGPDGAARPALARVTRQRILLPRPAGEHVLAMRDIRFSGVARPAGPARRRSGTRRARPLGCHVRAIAGTSPDRDLAHVTARARVQELAVVVDEIGPDRRLVGRPDRADHVALEPVHDGLAACLRLRGRLSALAQDLARGPERFLTPVVADEAVLVVAVAERDAAIAAAVLEGMSYRILVRRRLPGLPATRQCPAPVAQRFRRPGGRHDPVVVTHDRLTALAQIHGAVAAEGDRGDGIAGLGEHLNLDPGIVREAATGGQAD